MNHAQRYIILGTFLVASLLHGLQWYFFDAIDVTMWSSQAQYVVENNPKQFITAWAYGHPGAPIIIGTIATHWTLHLSYDDSLIVFLSLFNGLTIAVICGLCFLLSKNTLWWLAVLIPLSSSYLYGYSTPPSAVASLLIVLLCLFTLYICKVQKTSWKQGALWGFVAGLAIATRADIGGISFLFFLIPTVKKIGLKNVITATLTSIMTFIIVDPYMWYMPVQHIKDIIGKIFYHYAEFAPQHIPLDLLTTISLLTIISITVSILLFYKKRDLFPLPISFYRTILIMSFFLYVTFLTSHYQAARYFMPVIFIWETLLPLFILSVIPHIISEFNGISTKGLRLLFTVCLIAALAAQPVLITLQDLMINAQFLYH